MDKMELSRLIRFGLNDLSSRDGHHGFEEMCRFLAAQRIASNVYPATGPVAGGGDQGRDFQTFATAIREALGEERGFAALASDEPIAFACTLQKTGLEAKIRSDLAKIVGGQPPARKVYVMLAADLPVAKANALKAEASEKQGVELEVLDGQAIAEMLADREVFWIAARWLGIPAEFAPEPPEQEAAEPEWYVEVRGRWRESREAAQTTGELMDLRAGLRQAVFHRHARDDLGMWLELMRRTAAEAMSDDVRQKARYETAVGELRGRGNLRPADEFVREYLLNVDPAYAGWGELREASILVAYVFGAVMRANTDLDVEWALRGNQRLREGIETRLSETELRPTERVGLLEALGHLRAQIDLDEVEIADAPQEGPDALEGIDMADMSPPPSWIPLIDAPGAIEAWGELADLAPQAPLVPIDSLSRVFTFMAPVLVDIEGYRALAGRLDELQAEVGGNSAAAERSRDRAMALLKGGRPLEALVDLHDAKARWWQGDTLRGTLLSLMMLTRTYSELGLLFAARQQALLAVTLAFHYGEPTDRDVVVAALMQIGHLDYRGGSWCAAVESYNVALLAHLQESEDPWDMTRHEDFAALATHSAYLRAAAELLGSDTATAVRESQEEYGLGEILDEVEDLQASKSAEQWREDCLAQIDSLPYSDAGDIRTIRWSAMGVFWEVTAANTYSHCRAAERFAAGAQVLCAELAALEDLVLMPTTVRVRIQATDPDRRSDEWIRAEPGNEGSDWIVDLTPMTGDGSELDADAVGAELTAALGTVLFEASLLGWDSYMEILERCFERGLSHKITGGRPYDDLAGIVKRDHFEKFKRTGIQLPEEWRDAPTPTPVDGLGARTDAGPGYSKERAEEMIRGRYERSEQLLNQTLPHLAKDDQFISTYRNLQDAGWLDWHILLALVNSRINFRTASEGLTLEEARKQHEREPRHRDESAEEPPLPQAWLTVERLTMMRRFAFVSSLSRWGLDLHQQTPDLEAIEDLLGKRYGYWHDDVEHKPLLNFE
jgi:hypothetical protein